MPFLTHDGIEFHYRDSGTGFPFFFQHGLGGDVDQPFTLFQPPRGIRLLAFDCRAHGRTRPLGPEVKITLGTFGEDLLALMTALQINQAIIGGISMGAAIALNFVLRFPQHAAGLVLSRPAWLDGPNPWTARVYPWIAQLIRGHGPIKGLELLKQSELFQQTLSESPDTADSLCRQFLNARAADAVIRLETLPLDAPCRSLSALQSVQIPSLVMATRQDPVHPFAYGEVLHRALAGSAFHELTPKSQSPEQHRKDLQQALEKFLAREFSSPEPN